MAQVSSQHIPRSIRTRRTTVTDLNLSWLRKALARNGGEYSTSKGRHISHSRVLAVPQQIERPTVLLGYPF